MEQKHSAYWTIKDGQLKADEIVDSGYPTKEQAENASLDLATRYFDTHLIGKFITIEHDLPSDDPNYDPAQNYESERWCIVVSPRFQRR